MRIPLPGVKAAERRQSIKYVVLRELDPGEGKEPRYRRLWVPRITPNPEKEKLRYIWRPDVEDAFQEYRKQMGLAGPGEEAATVEETATEEEEGSE